MFLEADAKDLDVELASVEFSELPHPWLVVEDSAHTYEVTTAVLRSFATRFVPRDYMVVVTYNMDRELPRTLASLAPIQCGVEQLDYEIVVVDNGSTNALDCTTLSPEVIKRLRYRPLA